MVHPAHRQSRFGPMSGQAGRLKPRPIRISHRGPWKHGPIPVLGLIGGIGAGKSLAARAFERLGALVLDADAVGHRLLEQRPVKEMVLRRFGPEILTDASDDATGSTDAVTNSPAIDRRVLGTLVFRDPAARRALEAILHPRMRRTFEKAIQRAVRKRQHSAVVLDAAILLEAGWDDLCDLVVFIDAPRNVRRDRLAASRGWTDEMLAAREASQWPLEEKRRRADAVLMNISDTDHLNEAIQQFWRNRVIEPRRGRPS